MRNEPMNTESSKSDRFGEARRYAHATVDYIGLVMVGMIRRSSTAAKDSTMGIVTPIGRNLSRPFVGIKDMASSIFRGKAYVDQRFVSIIERIRMLEERLDFLEKHGIRLASGPEYQKKKKELDDERKGLLDLIVEENKRLRQMVNA